MIGSTMIRMFQIERVRLELTQLVAVSSPLTGKSLTPLTNQV